jgi:hypothetical protein
VEGGAFVKSLGEFVVIMALGIPQTLVSGLVLSQMWSWFIATRFGLPRLSYLESIGVMQVFGFFTLPLVSKDAWRKFDESEEHSTFAKGVIKSLTMLLFIYPLCWGVAFVWHLIIGDPR